MIINLYINQGKVINSLVDESTSHQLGDIVSIDNCKFKIKDMEQLDHYDYSTIIKINYVDIFVKDIGDMSD